jgi:hypothetical protein
MRVLKILFLSFALTLSTISTANAASLADCISVTGGKFKEWGSSSTYEITVRNACGDSFKESLNYSSLSFYAGSSVLNPETASIFYLQSYGQTFSFKLGNLKAGTYSPYLKIFSGKDYSSRTVYLPGFSIADPLNCVAITGSEFIGSKFDPSLRVSVMNSCSNLESNSFSGIQFSLKLPGYTPYIVSKSINFLDSSGSSLVFSLQEIKSGSYYPSLEIKDSNYQTIRVNLETFYVSSTPTPTSSPTKSAVTGKKGSSSQVCATSKGIVDQCSDYPFFSFSVCSNLQKASLQEKTGSTWVFLWTVTGTKDSSVCSDSRYPYYILASGNNKTRKKTDLRLVFTKTSKLGSFTRNFSLVVR